MKIGIGQINPTIGDFSGNVELLLNIYRKCVEGGADLVVTPELAIPGYPPRDMVYRSGFVDGNLQALQDLARETGSVPLITGFVDFSKEEAGAPFVNAAAVLQDGEVKQVVSKCLLPTYDVFDEARYFQPGNEVEPIEIAGKRIGITICEDIWSEDHLPSKLYVKNPPKALVKKGAEIILNLSASPYHQGKAIVREEMMSGLCRDLKSTSASDLGCAPACFPRSHLPDDLQIPDATLFLKLQILPGSEFFHSGSLKTLTEPQHRPHYPPKKTDSASKPQAHSPHQSPALQSLPSKRSQSHHSNR